MTEKKINEARESYRPAAARASLMYFILNDLNKISPIYQFSLKVVPKCSNRMGPELKYKTLGAILRLLFAFFVI